MELIRRSSQLAKRTNLSFFFFFLFSLSHFFHGQVTIKFNTKILDRVGHGNRCTTYSHRLWEEGRERPRLSTRECNHCFGLVIVKEFKFVYCHSGVDVLNTGTSAWRGDLGFDDGPQISGVESHRCMNGEG